MLMHLNNFPVKNKPSSKNIHEMEHRINLPFLASDAAEAMGFESNEEMYNAVKKAIEIFGFAGIPIVGNFKRIYKSASKELVYDWKLSMLAYRLVCISGNTSNPNVASLIIQILENEHLNHS